METLFLKLVNLSITASWMVLAVFLMRLVFRKAPKWVFCLLWELVALRLICPISIESAFSLIPSVEPLPQDILYTAAPKIQSGVRVIDDFVNPVLLSSMSPAPGESANPTQIWSFLLAWIWAAGVIVTLLYALISYLFLRRRVATATLLRDNIKQSESVDSPFVLGLFRPVIYLPYSIADSDITYVIAHEKAHIRRKDHWWKPMGFVLLAVYWFNPLLWVAYVLLCRDIEAACDEKVICEMEKEDRRAYSTALLRCSVRHRAIAACPLAFGETGVKSRIKDVMNYKKPAFWIVLLAVAACLAVAVCFLTDPVAAVRNPWTQEYVPGTGNILGNVDKEKFEAISKDFAIGADRYGRAVFKDPYKAFDTFVLLYADGIALIQEQNNLTPISRGNYDLYKVYGWQTTSDSGEVQTQAEFVTKFLDIYENSFTKEIPKENTKITTAESEPTLLQWFDYLDTPSEMEPDLTLELPVFPGTTFRYTVEKIAAEKQDGSAVPLIQGMPIWNAYFCDVTGDGVPDLCATYSFGFGMIDTRFICYDYQNDISYEMSDRGVYDYSLRSEGGQLYADKRAYGRSTLLATGRLAFEDGYLRIAYAGGVQAGSILLTPGTSYVSWQCLYMNPLSSYVSDDSGYRYEIGKDSFSIIRLRGGVDASGVPVGREAEDAASSENFAGREPGNPVGSEVSVRREVDHASRHVKEMIPVSKWEWQEFLYTDEEWEALFWSEVSAPIDIRSLYGEILYQPLDNRRFLLLADGDLLIVELQNSTQMGKYIWSIYSLIDEMNMGVAQWEYAPELSSRLPAFRFAFDMEYAEISAICTNGKLVDFDSQSVSQTVFSDTSLTLPKGNALYWSPMEESDGIWQASDSAIDFYCTRENGSQFSGTIYITAGGSSNGRTIYTATLVGTGLHLSPDTETEGGVISLLATDTEFAVTEYDLRDGKLELSPIELSQYVFFTNSQKIAVTVKCEDDFEGTVILRDISQNNVEIMRKDVNRKDQKAVFTGLTSARLYRIEYDGAENCTIVVSQK